MSKLTLIRGLPGSGKSTLARKIALETGALHVEADMWINYSEKWRQESVKMAHAICQEQANKALYYGRDTVDGYQPAPPCGLALYYGRDVVVSNTFTQQWEMQPYLDMARKYGVQVEVITATGDYGSVHNVPAEAMQAMRERWEEVVL